MKKKVELTIPEERFYDLLVDYEIASMIKELKTQVWIKTSTGYRRIDFVLIIDTDIDNRKGIYIEIDDLTHRNPERKYDDIRKETEIFNSSFPLLRFTYDEVFNDTKRVMNKIEGAIELMRNA